MNKRPVKYCSERTERILEKFWSGEQGASSKGSGVRSRKIKAIEIPVLLLHRVLLDDFDGFDTHSKSWKESTGKAKFVGDPSVAKLKVSFFGPIYAGYNVVAVDAEYRYALVAGRNRHYLWLLSREKTMPESVKADYLTQATRAGYDTAKLVWTKQ